MAVLGKQQLASTMNQFRRLQKQAARSVGKGQLRKHHEAGPQIMHHVKEAGPLSWHGA